MARRHEWESGGAGDLARRPFVLRIEVGMQKRDGAGLVALGHGGLQRSRQGLAVERAHDPALGVQALVGLDDAGVERRRAHDGQGEQVRPGLVADQHAVGEPLGGDEQRLRPVALQQGVGGDGGAHLDGLHPLGRKGLPRTRAQHPAHGFHRGVGIGGRGRKQLGRGFLARLGTRDDLADDVGEGSAPVDPEAPGRVQNLTRVAIASRAARSYGCLSQ